VLRRNACDRGSEIPPCDFRRGAFA
jgi:hypothetical protein